MIIIYKNFYRVSLLNIKKIKMSSQRKDERIVLNVGGVKVNKNTTVVFDSFFWYAIFIYVVYYDWGS
jgi:hypothetical protein